MQEHLIPGAYKFDALITTFEMVLSDCPELREIAWRCVIIDEAHRLKNRNCKLLDSLKMLDLVSGPQLMLLNNRNTDIMVSSTVLIELKFFHLHRSAPQMVLKNFQTLANLFLWDLVPSASSLIYHHTVLHSPFFFSSISHFVSCGSFRNTKCC